MADIQIDCKPSQPLSWEFLDIEELTSFLDDDDNRSTDTCGLFQLDVSQPSINLSSNICGSESMGSRLCKDQSPRSPFMPLTFDSLGSLGTLKGFCSPNPFALESAVSFKSTSSLASLGSFETFNIENICSNTCEAKKNSEFAESLPCKRKVTQDSKTESPHPAHAKCNLDFIKDDSLSPLFELQNQDVHFQLEEKVNGAPPNNIFEMPKCGSNHPKRICKFDSSPEVKSTKQNSCSLSRLGATSQNNNRSRGIDRSVDRLQIQETVPNPPQKHQNSDNNSFPNVILQKGIMKEITLPNLKWEGHTFSCQDLEKQIASCSDGWSLSKIRRCRAMLRLYRKRQHGKFGIFNRPRYTSRQVYANARRRTATGKFARTK